MVNEHTGVYKRPDTMRGDRSKRNQSKYCPYHEDVGHTTEECITLNDEIEKLIREAYLRSYIRNGGAQPHEDRREAEPPRVIKTIFSRPHFAGETQGAQNRYLQEARDEPVLTANYPDQRPTK